MLEISIDSARDNRSILPRQSSTHDLSVYSLQRVPAVFFVTYPDRSRFVDSLSTPIDVTTIRKFATVLIVIGATFVAIYWFTRPDPIEMLIERNVPVPADAVATNSEYGGTFAQYLFVRIELTTDELHQYLQVLPDGISLNSPSGLQVVKTDLSDAEMMQLIEQGTEMRFKHVVNGGYLSWWQIDSITNGTYHQQELENACSYEIFVDEDKSVVYIYWHYS